MFYRNGIELELCLRMSPLKCDRSQPSKMFIAGETMHELQPYQISIYYLIILYFKFMKFNTPHCFGFPNIVQIFFCT